MNQQVRSSVGLAVVGALDAVALCRFAPAPGELRRGIIAPHAWISQVGSDAAIGATAGALLWLAALWLLLGLLVTLAAALAGQPRGVLDGISRRVTPALLRRLVIASTGATLVLAPTTAIAAPMTAQGPIAAVTPRTSVEPCPVPTLPAATTPTLPMDPAPPMNPAPPMDPVAPVDPAPPMDPAPPTDPGPAANSVVVRPGDSLWQITAEQLGPSASEQQIAVGWPYWYRANRRVIGSDANLLRPGERLTPPAPEKGR